MKVARELRIVYETFTKLFVTLSKHFRECILQSVSNGCCRMALHYASCMVHHSSVMSLTASGAKINVVDTKGCCPLHYAAAYDSDAK